MERVTVRTEGSATGVGRLGSFVPPVEGKRREVVRAGEGGLGRDRIFQKNRKEPFEWDNVGLFAEAYGVRQKGYIHLVVASMAVIMFGAMCRYDDASGLKWCNIRFVEDGSGFEITFEKRKNAQYRQGNRCRWPLVPMQRYAS